MPFPLTHIDGEQWLGASVTSLESRIAGYVAVANVKNATFSGGAAGDGVTDDTAAIQAAQNSLPASGGVVYLPSSSGAYRFNDATFTLRSNVIWRGDGWGQSTLKMLDGANGRGIDSSATLSSIGFEYLTWDFNAVNQTDGANRDARSGHMLSNITGLAYRYCEITGVRSGAALRLSGCNRTLLTGNWFHDNGFSTTLTGAQTLGGTNFTLNVASTTGFAGSGTLNVADLQTVTYTGLTGTSFVGCNGGSGTVTDGAAVLPMVSAAPMLADHNYNADADYLRVYGNTYERGTDTGTAQDGMQHTSVFGNVYDTNTLGVSIANSAARSSVYNTVTGNSIRGGGARFVTCCGIRISQFQNAGNGNPSDGVITGNVVHDADRALWVEQFDRMNIGGNSFGSPNANSPNRQAILVGPTGTVNNSKIHGNVLHDALTGIRFGGTQVGLEVTGNQIVNCTTAVGGTVPTLASAVRFRDNVGYNPLGVTTVTVGASPYTYTAGCTPEMVHISGGSVSSVAKDGVTLFSGTNVSIFLQPGEQLTITYSVAPAVRADRK